jgi:putative SOS response-associated peptidase YedK
MPVILGEDEWGEWLHPATSIDSARAMDMPCPSEWLIASARGRLANKFPMIAV